ncbi:hypothetical protein H7E67_17540 [Clostridium gasigenes]|uniref:hypothetical protein n=1 Tax=Clostridium gasigenes TaxID=94869 RepID=UPI00162A604B|nr:hypothetical protein [Clostridium gasigenes]MBB6625222.1 hypothetical protein [Clostridium gasigenes]
MKNGRFKIICRSEGNQEIFKEYDDVEKVVNDMHWRDPSIFFIADDIDKQGYTLEQFTDKFAKKS